MSAPASVAYSRPSRPRLAITGLGPVCSRSSGARAFADLLRAGANVTPAEALAASAAPAPTATVGRSGYPPALRQMDGLGRLAVGAATLAMSDAGLSAAADEGEGMGLALGTGYGCLAANSEYLDGIRGRGTRFGNPIVFQNTVPNAATGYTAIATGIRGPNATFASGMGAGAEALSFARDAIGDGHVHAALAGSADQLSAAARLALALRGPLSPSGIARPFDKRRDGLVPKEGACLIVLEDLDHARRRGARVYAELVGIGHAGGIDEERPPVAEAVRAALADAGLDAAQVDLVFSGANGSRDGDRGEARSLREALGRDVPVTCPKAWIGETVGGGGPFGLAAAALALYEGLVGFAEDGFEADPDCEVIVLKGPLGFDLDVALVPVAGDDGTAHAIVVQRCQS